MLKGLQLASAGDRVRLKVTRLASSQHSLGMTYFVLSPRRSLKPNRTWGFVVAAGGAPLRLHGLKDDTTPARDLRYRLNVKEVSPLTLRASPVHASCVPWLIRAYSAPGGSQILGSLCSPAIAEQSLQSVSQKLTDSKEDPGNRVGPGRPAG